MSKKQDNRLATCPKCNRSDIEPTEIEWRYPKPEPHWLGFKFVCTDCWHQGESFETVEEARKDFSAR